MTALAKYYTGDLLEMKCKILKKTTKEFPQTISVGGLDIM